MFTCCLCQLVRNTCNNEVLHSCFNHGAGDVRGNTNGSKLVSTLLLTTLTAFSGLPSWITVLDHPDNVVCMGSGILFCLGVASIMVT